MRRRDFVYRIDLKKKEVVIIKKILTSFKRGLTLKEINLHINENIFKVISRWKKRDSVQELAESEGKPAL